MLKDFLDALGKIKSRSLLVVFAALALSTFMPEGGPLKNPFSVGSLTLFFFVIFAEIMVICWMSVVHHLNSRLADHDLASWGPYLGGTVLAFCLCVTFWHVSSTPDPVNLKLLGTEGFIRVFALYLLAIETINIKRHFAQQ